MQQLILVLQPILPAGSLFLTSSDYVTLLSQQEDITVSTFLILLKVSFEMPYKRGFLSWQKTKRLPVENTLTLGHATLGIAYPISSGKV